MCVPFREDDDDNHMDRSQSAIAEVVVDGKDENPNGRTDDEVLMKVHASPALTHLMPAFTPRIPLVLGQPSSSSLSPYPFPVAVLLVAVHFPCRRSLSMSPSPHRCLPTLTTAGHIRRVCRRVCSRVCRRVCRRVCSATLLVGIGAVSLYRHVASSWTSIDRLLCVLKLHPFAALVHPFVNIYLQPTTISAPLN